MSENLSPELNVDAAPNEHTEAGQPEDVKKSESSNGTSAESATEEKGSEEQNDSASSDETSKESETADSKWLGRRLERAKAKERQSAQAEIEYWKKAAMAAQGVNPNVSQANAEVVNTQTMPLQKPTLSDFNGDVESYTDAVTDWKLARKLDEVNSQQKAALAKQSYAQRAEEFAKKEPDFPNVINDFIRDYEGVNVPELMTLAMESEVGPALVHYLAKNDQEMERIIDLPSHRRLIELGKLEDKLSSPKVAAPQKTSKAPPPVKPVTGTAPSDKTLEDLAKDSSVDNKAWREMRMKQRMGRF